MGVFKHILVPTDFGEPSTRALHTAMELAKDMGARLSLIHVWEVPAWAYGGIEFTAVDYLTPVQEAAEKDLDEAVASVRDKIPGSEGILRQGVAWKEILAAIESTHADLVVMGTHGRYGLGHAILGSVAEKVVRLSPVPVLTVREPPRIKGKDSPPSK